MQKNARGETDGTGSLFEDADGQTDQSGHAEQQDDAAAHAAHAAQQPSEPAAESVQLVAHNGTYTVDHKIRGHVTVKLYTKLRGALAGRRVVALLTGPDNERDFSDVAFWDEQRRVVYPWRRFTSAERTMPINGLTWGDRWNPTEKRLAIWMDLLLRGTTESRHGYWYSDGYRLLLESRCVRCNRKLTTPESIRSGIGPECAGRV